MNHLDTICASDLLKSELTRRARQVLGLMLEGQSNEEISKALGISEKTTKSYVTQVLTCFGVDSRYKLLYVSLTYIIERLRAKSNIEPETKPEVLSETNAL